MDRIEERDFRDAQELVRIIARSSAAVRAVARITQAAGDAVIRDDHPARFHGGSESAASIGVEPDAQRANVGALELTGLPDLTIPLMDWHWGAEN
ncbi:hypothetical protein [Sorangium cellulosum]|uniref:hypothetical protein n=1 Tax=Sorangium cellulosum TaxID=56 RepID=UPI0012FF6D49|nr:hypothetical protein [Sorangium cellulosum]